ncbi:MAG TPA: Hsp70 family protein [Myxococcota bacterium]|nr:Hsp70 family protein [Myxococcota bacterium]
MAEVAIGIDLGTSNSCVALARGGKVEVLPNAYGESITASVVAFAEDGSITVGNAAKANIIHDPKHTIYSSKRLIGRYFFSEEVKKAKAICSYEMVEGPNHSVRIKVRGEEFSLPEISAMILREMKSIAEARLGQTVTKAVITVPAYFNDNQRQATKDAGRIAGLEVLRILNEPTAAALSYGFGKGLNQRVAIYDLGGGTFDISVLEIGTDVFEVLSTCGDTFLGGDDLDDRLIDLLADEFVAKEGINLRNDPYALEKLKVAAEAAKKGLSLEDEVEVRIPDVIVGPDGRGRSVERRITTQEYSSLVMDLVMRTFKVCDEALQQANVVARDLAGVILVGGPTRLPLIRNAVKEYFQREPRTDVNPDEVVALGAAIHAASLLSPQQEAYLLDVTPLSLKIGVASGLAETVIDRNTPVPIEQTRSFTTFQDFQESVNIRVYQGESRQAAENELLGQFHFSGFKKARRGEVRIDVTFEINSDGIVNVTARDPATGQQASTQITLSSGLSEAEIQKIMERDRTAQVVPSAVTAGAVPQAVKTAAAPPAVAAGAPLAAAPSVAAPAAPLARSAPLFPPPPPSRPIAARPAPAAPPSVAVDASDELEVLPDDLPELAELYLPAEPAEAQADSSHELVAMDEPASLPGGDGPADFEITGGFSPLQPAAEPAKASLEIGGLDGAPDEKVPIDTPAEDLFDRNYKDLSSPTEDISIDLEIGPEKKGK